MSSKQNLYLLGLARQGEAWVESMRVLGIPPRMEAECYRGYAVFARALALVEAGEWPPAAGWADDLLDPGLVPPPFYTMERYRKEVERKPHLRCVSGGRS
jgi:hypothetical protein